MKISKLFHYIYAVVMLLPVLAILSAVLIATFNEGLVNVDLQNVFYTALSNIQSSPVFAWASTSFLVAPFEYICVLFGMSSTNVIITLLSYWLDISIIWLVFDLIMYVPLLVHRWIDKGIIE